MVQGGIEQVEVFGGGLLGEFDHHPAGRDAEGLQHLQGAPRLVRRVEQGFGGDVEEQQAFEIQCLEAAAGAAPAGHFQFAQAPGVAGHGEQGHRWVQRAVGRAAGQCLVAEDAPFGQRQDRLEQAVQVAVSEDLAQRAQLLGDGHGATREKDGGRICGPRISRQLCDGVMTSDQCFATAALRPR
ncbi:hypothetical protein D3C81_1635800 [compost metagenome]